MQNHKIANLQKCKNTNLQKYKFAKIENLQNCKNHKWQKNTIIIKRGQMQKFIIFSSSRRHQTLSYRGSNGETGSQNPTKSPSNVPDAHLLTPSPASPIVIATKLWIFQSHYIPVRCAPVLAVLAVMHVFCLRPDYRYLVCRIATYLSVFYNPIAICSKLSVYCYFVRNCLCVGILFKIALVFAAKTIILEHCPIFGVFVVTYT